MVRLPPVVGANHARLTSRPCRAMIAAVAGILFLAVMGGAVLANVGLQRDAAFHRAQART